MKAILASTICFLTFGGSISEAQTGRRVQIINRSTSPIEYLHASNSDYPRWDEDILGPMRVLRPGQSIDANIGDGSRHCRYDLRAILLDGREAVESDFNVCANISWTVNPKN
jgi:hypothetical protein